MARVSVTPPVLSLGLAVCRFKCAAASVSRVNPAIRLFEIQSSQVPWNHY